jgi:hypothetical protein
VGDERPLRGGEPVASREGVAVAGTPLRFSALPGHAGGEMRVVEGGDGGWGEVQRVKEGDREALRRNGAEVVGEDTSGANREVAARKNLRIVVGAEELNREGAPGGRRIEKGSR